MNSDNEPMIKSPMDHPMNGGFQLQDAFEDHIQQYQHEGGEQAVADDENENNDGISVKAASVGNAYASPRCPNHPGLTGNAIPLPPNLAGVGIAGPLLWQIGSSAENLAANIIGSLAGGIISGLGLQGYLTATAGASGGVYQDNPLLGRGVFDTNQGTNPGNNPNSQLNYIVSAFLNSDFAGKLLSILSAFVNSNNYQNPHVG